MVVSQNRGTPIWTPKYYNPYYRDPQKGTPNFGKLPYSKLPGWSKEVGMAFVLPRAALQCVPLAANEPRDGQGIGMIVRLVIVIVIVRILLMTVEYSYCWYDLVVIIVRILAIIV